MGAKGLNIFILDWNPFYAARMLCDKHLPKMCVETAQMLASAILRHDPKASMPLTKKGTPYRGGYHHHPCTIWTGDSRLNFEWLVHHGRAMCEEYTRRFGKVHACEAAINHLAAVGLTIRWPALYMTTPAQAMPDEYKDDDAVVAYRRYYHSKTFAKWEKGSPTPSWWKGLEVTA